MRLKPTAGMQAPENLDTGMTSEAVPADIRVGVVIASLGRSAECADILEALRNQSVKPSVIAMSVEKAGDLPENLTDDIRVVMGPRGLCAQRNRGVALVRESCDVIVFFDDDFIPTSRSIEGLARLFGAFPDIVGATGHVIADGVGQGGVSREVALQLVSAYDAEASCPPVPEPGQAIVTAYGCNMAFRVTAMANVAFDERLPLYGWQEDVDYAGQISRYGTIVKTTEFGGVHRGVTSSRTPGARLGFSQIVNPIYLARKGSMRWGHAARIMAGNVLANHLKLVRPEPHIDRAGRARGNWIALGHILSGRLEPEAMLLIDQEGGRGRG